MALVFLKRNFVFNPLNHFVSLIRMGDCNWYNAPSLLFSHVSFFGSLLVCLISSFWGFRLCEQDNYKKPSYVQISVESYAHLTGLEDQVKTYEKQVQTLEDQIKEFNEKLSAAHSEMTTKDNLVKQHAKVAEEAVSGIILILPFCVKE